MTEKSKKIDQAIVEIKKLPSQADLIEAAIEIQSRLHNAALLGGLAMQFYGSPRLTADVDVAANGTSGILGKPLSFGGVRTSASNGVEVDIIVRNDEWQILYMSAASQGIVNFSSGGERKIRTVCREFLVSIKIASGRDKDISDAKFLLVQPALDLALATRWCGEHLGRYGVQEMKQLREIAIWEDSKAKKGLK
jgi:hypothetical protein